jgi:hypothetical protein
MFDNSFVDQYRFDYSKSSNSKYGEILNPNMIVNVDNKVDNEIDDEIIPHIPEFGDIFGSTFVVSHD